MMFSLFSRIRACRAAVLDIFLSAIGCLILRRCFRLVVAGRYSLDTNKSVRAYEQPRDPFVDMGSALILLALAVNEPPGLMRARRL